MKQVKDIFYHTIVSTVIALAYEDWFGVDWWQGALIGGSYLLIREIAQAQVRLTSEGYNSRITRGWHTGNRGVFTWKRTGEWLVPTILTAGILYAA